MCFMHTLTDSNMYANIYIWNFCLFLFGATPSVAVRFLLVLHSGIDLTVFRYQMEFWVSGQVDCMLGKCLPSVLSHQFYI